MTNTRRNFLKMAGLAPLARYGAINAFAGTPVNPNYKALVCIFLFGGNDGNNMIVPAPGTAQYNAYKTIRGSIALPDPNATLQGMGITAKNGTPYALNDGLKLILPLWASGQLAIVANVGLLVQPTTQAQYQGAITGGPAVPLPTNLFSHADQQVQMQAGIPFELGIDRVGGPGGRRRRRAERRHQFSGVGFGGRTGVVLEGKRGAIGEPDSGVQHAVERLQHVAAGGGAEPLRAIPEPADLQ